MRLFGLNITFDKKERRTLAEIAHEATKDIPMPPQRRVLPEAWAGGGYTSSWAIGATPYTGEKNMGEMGPLQNYFPTYEMLRVRSWDLYRTSEVCQTVINRYTTWTISTGLKLQATPQIAVLKQEKIKLKAEEFNKSVEPRFKVFAASKMASLSGMESLNMMSREGFKNVKVSGDMLVILRLVKGHVKVQHIDGAHLQTPPGIGSPDIDGTVKLPGGNRVLYGVELDADGQHVAFYVMQTNLKYERIPARGGKTNMQFAYLVYGSKGRMGEVRGLPLISAIMETISKMERYKEATLAGAEERAKIAIFFKHGLGSTGENPIKSVLAKVANADAPGQIPVDVAGNEFANKVAASFSKQAYNMPIDTDISTVAPGTETNFAGFYDPNFDLICATVGIPPNVAKSKYDSNYSASRAAIKDWEHTLWVERGDIAEQYFQPIYNFWLEVQILSNKIDAPGYLKASAEQNIYALEAYRTARFVGTPVPHIDPLKEVQAERAKLGPLFANYPLSNGEAATENLNSGDSESNVEQAAKELEHAEGQGLELKPPPPAGGPYNPEDDDPDAADEKENKKKEEK